MINKIKHGWNLLKSATRDLNRKEKRSPKWDELRDSFIKLNNKCAACGSSIRLQVHHKKPFHDYPELELDPNNLITLCMSEKECHLRIAHGGAFSKWCPEIDLYINQIHNKEKTFDEIYKIAKESRLDSRI